MSHVTKPKGRGVKHVTIFTIKPEAQRYPTTGDWVYDPKTGDLFIYVSKTGDWREEQAIAFHEYCEALLCIQHGVVPNEVDAFDIKFEKHRRPEDCTEPGDNPKAPYYHEHQTATCVEHILTEGLGLHWNTYDKNCGAESDVWNAQKDTE